MSTGDAVVADALQLLASDLKERRRLRCSPCCPCSSPLDAPRVGATYRGDWYELSCESQNATCRTA